jgi:hypothetical protein
MGPLIPLGALLLVVLATSRRSSAAPVAQPPQASPDFSPLCGPYPALSNGWRPVCTAPDPGLTQPTSLVVPSRVVLWIQEGRRAHEDETNMAVVEAEVVAQSVGISPPVYTLRLVRVINTYRMLPGAVLPPVGTLWNGVRAAFVDPIGVAGAVAQYGGPSPGTPGTVATGPGTGTPDSGTRGPGGPGGNRPPEQFPGEGGQQFEEGLTNNPAVAGWNASVGACGGGMPFPVPMYYGNPYAQPMVGYYPQQYGYYGRRAA